jgi:hypothetical protein
MRCVNDDVGIRRLLSEQIGAVEVAVDETDLGILCCDFGAFVARADQSCNLELGMGVGNGVEGVAANVACGSGAVGLLDVYWLVVGSGDAAYIKSLVMVQG